MHIYILQNFAYANAQHMNDKLNRIENTHRLLAEQQRQHLGPQVAHIYNNSVQQAYIAQFIDASQSSSSTTNQAVINPIIQMNSQGPPPDPGADSARIKIIEPPRQIKYIKPDDSYIGTPRRQRGDRSRSASLLRGRSRRTEKEIIKPIGFTTPTPTTEPEQIKNIGIEENG
jgi:hypothetical protein